MSSEKCDGAAPGAPGDADYRKKYLQKDDAWLALPTPFERLATRFNSHVLKTHVPPGKAVLDIGCNKGFLLAALWHYRTVGVDLSFGFRAAGPAYVIGDAEALPFQDGTFDGIVMAEVVEHLPDCNACYGEVRRVLRDGGILLLTHPNKDNPFQHVVEAVKENRWIRKALGRSDYVGSQHLQEYSLRDSKRQLEAFGMRLLEFHTPSLCLIRLLSPLIYGRLRCEPFFKVITALGRIEEKIALPVGRLSSLLPAGYIMLFKKER